MPPTRPNTRAMGSGSERAERCQSVPRNVHFHDENVVSRRARKELEGLKEERQGLQVKYDALERDHEDLKIEMGGKKDQLEKLEKKVKELKADFKSEVDKNVKQQKEINSLRLKMAKEREAAVKEIDELRKQKDSAEKKLALGYNSLVEISRHVTEGIRGVTSQTPSSSLESSLNDTQ